MINSFLNLETIIILGGFVSVNLWMDYEKRIRIVPNIKGYNEGQNRIINFIDLLIFVGILILSFSTMKWWVALIQFVVLFFLAPFISGLIAFFLNAKTISILALFSKIFFLIFIIVLIVK